MAIYKTVVTVDVGFSIQTPSGDWQKQTVSIGTEMGPEYPSDEFLRWQLLKQVADASYGANEAINLVVDKINAKINGQAL